MHPILLAGVALVGLPVLLHLILKQEPKRLPFPALRFLQQKKKVSQRKLRLKQLLLLALRCLLVALFALALYQPRLSGSGLAGLADEQPVACVLLVDTSPSMGYQIAGVTRLADARKRALELLDELPAGSKVAVLDPADPAVQWEPTAGDARRRLESLLDPHGGGPPLTTGLTAAYQLLRTADEDQPEPLPKLVAVFTDRAVACWPADRTADLKSLAAQLPPPGVSHLVFDVGTDGPANVSVLDLVAKPASGPAGQPVTLTATLKSVGGDVDAEAALSLDDGPPQPQAVRLVAGQPTAVRFALTDLPKGLHQAKVTVRDDALAADNVRHVTFKVGDARTILTVCDDPAAANLWALAHEAKGEFNVVVTTPDEAKDFSRYEFVTLLGLADPGKPLADGKSLWDRLQPYLAAGGKLLVVLGGEGINPAGYDRPFLPGKLTRLVDSTRQPAPTPGERDRRLGAVWVLDEAAERQPLLAPFKDWERAGVGFIKDPRKTVKYWAADAPGENVVVRYDDADRTPAVLEKTLPGGGRVVLLTTRLDGLASDPADKWNDNWTLDGTDWPTVWPHRLAVHLAGASGEATFTYPTGQPVTLTLPKGGLPKGTKLTLEGPGVNGPDATQPVADGQTEWRLPPPMSLTAGSYRLRAGDWQDGFSLNPPADEFDLTKVPAERIEEATGPGSVVPVGKAVTLREVLDRKLGGELNLFPYLLIGVLLLFAGEGLLANRFYRR
ncbi:vWA domain-containing protein [Brasilonema bromeliae]|uniref:VWFA domain-containing protein n=1 Tax=Brasilonema bromeliae SPC951 TaxID=385972 RepID=A0ABX1P8Y7_9CYAN|nr:vWA domain-containing protein [Brasilonema bromeliae]NMG20381.1 hypothetical protein [Brasilonema bromeliae SPC951]